MCLPASAGHLEQQRSRAAGGVVGGGGRLGVGGRDAEHLCDDAADFGRGVELALGLARFAGEVAHQVFVGVAQDVIALSAVLREVERGGLEDCDQVGEAIHHFLAAAKFRGVVEIRHVGQFVGVSQRPEDLLVDLVADVALALERGHVLEAGARGNRDRGEGHAGVLVADILHEEQDEDVVLVLARVHAAAQFVATGPEGGVEFRFLDCHANVLRHPQRLWTRRRAAATHDNLRKLHPWAWHYNFNAAR